MTANKMSTWTTTTWSLDPTTAAISNCTRLETREVDEICDNFTSTYHSSSTSVENIHLTQNPSLAPEEFLIINPSDTRIRETEEEATKTRTTKTTTRGRRRRREEGEMHETVEAPCPIRINSRKRSIFRVPIPSYYSSSLIILLIISLAISPSHSVLNNNDLEEDEAESISLHRQVEPQVLQRLESHFLKLFKMERRPVRRRGEKIKVPKYLIDMYEAQTGLTLGTSNLNLPGRHTRTANTVRTFYDDNQNHDESEQQQFIHFDLSSIPVAEEVTGAELRIPLHLVSLENTGESKPKRIPKRALQFPKKVRVIVSDVSKKPKKNSNSEPIMYAMDTKIVDLSKAKSSDETIWLTMDVFPAVGRWLKDSSRNYGLVVQIFDVKTGELISSQTLSGQEGKHLRVKREAAKDSSERHSETPVLFTYSDDGLHKRKTRDARTLSRHYRQANENKNKQRNRGKGHRNKGKKRNLCARHRMFVDFTDVGWNDWIVAPPGYEAHHCSGECPFPMADHLNATNHAVIQALVNSMNPQYVPPPCCVPTKYSSLSLLYTDASDKIVLKNYNEMVVDSCGCS